MKRKNFKFILAIAVALSLTVTAAAGSTIVDSMELQGKAVELTLDQAVSVMLDGSIALPGLICVI